MFDRYRRSHFFCALSKHFEVSSCESIKKTKPDNTRNWNLLVGLPALGYRRKISSVSHTILISHDSTHDSPTKNLKLEIGVIVVLVLQVWCRYTINTTKSPCPKFDYKASCNHLLVNN
jgi:hypothetical protein